MRLCMMDGRLVGLGPEGARAWDVDGEAPAVVAERAYRNPWTDAWGWDVGGAFAQAPDGRVAVGTTREDGAVEVLVLGGDLEVAFVTRVDTTLELWNLAWSVERGVFVGHLPGDGVVVIDAASGEVAREFDGHISSGAACAPGGRLVAAADSGQGGGELYLLDLDVDDPEAARRGLPAPTSRAPMFDASVCAAFSPDGARVAFTSVAWGVRGVAVYEVASGLELWSTQYEMRDPDEELWDALPLAFADGGRLLLVGAEGTLRAFDAGAGDERSSLDGLGEDAPPYFAVDEARRCVWTTRDGAPLRHGWPSGW